MSRGREKVKMVTGLGGGYFCWRRGLPHFWACSVPTGVCSLLKWKDSGRWHTRSIWPILLLNSSQNTEVFYNWLSGSQECIFILLWCLKPCIPPNSSFLVCCMAYVIPQPFSLGWLGQWAFLLWHGSVHNALHASWAVWTSSSGAGHTANPALFLAVSVVPGLLLFLSPPLLLSWQRRLKSSLDRGWSSPRLYSAVWMETRGRSVPLGTSLNINDA